MLFGAFGVPFGLSLIIICGADLFTANTCFMTAAYFEVRQMMRARPLVSCCTSSSLAEGCLRMIEGLLSLNTSHAGQLALAVNEAFRSMKLRQSNEL